MYHVMNRGDQREDIFRDDPDRQKSLARLGEACATTAWQVGKELERLGCGKGSAIRAFVNSAKTLRVRYSFSTGFYCSSTNRLRRPDPNLGFHCVNRIFAGLARRGDPFSQPSGSSAFSADVLA
jgi:hypothetical protein